MVMCGEISICQRPVYHATKNNHAAFVFVNIKISTLLSISLYEGPVNEKRVVCNILEKDLDIYDATVMPPAILVWDQLPHDTKSSRYKITVKMFCPSHPRS